MSFFSSEEHIEEWAEQHTDLRGETVTMEQGLTLITGVATGRLNYDFYPPSGPQTSQILQAAKLVSDFWKPK